MTPTGARFIFRRVAFKVFTTAEVLATVVQPEDDLCAALIKVETAYRMAYQYNRYKYTDTGTLSDAFCAEVKTCAALAPPTT